MSEDWKQEFVLHEEAPAKIDATFLGKKEFGSRLVLKRKGQTQWVQYERIPLLAVLIFMIVFGINRRNCQLHTTVVINAVVIVIVPV